MKNIENKNMKIADLIIITYLFQMIIGIIFTSVNSNHNHGFKVDIVNFPLNFLM